MSEGLTITIKEVTSGGGSSGDDKKSEKTNKKGFSGVMKGLSKLLAPLAAIGLSITLFYDAMKPVVQLLKYILFLVLYPILKILTRVFPPGIAKDVIAGAEVHSKVITGDWADGKMFAPVVNAAKKTADEFEKGNYAMTLFGGIVTILTGALNALEIVVGMIFIVFKSFGAVLVKFGAWLVRANEAIRKFVIEALVNVLKFFIITLPQLLEDAFGWVSSTADDIKNWFIEAFESIVDVGIKIKNWFIEAFENIVDVGINIKNWFLQAFEDVVNWGNDIWAIFLDGLSGIADFASDIWDLFKSGLSGIGGLGSDIVNWVKKKLGFGGSDNSDPHEAFGGTVGHDGSYYLHAGESVNTPGQSSGSSNTFNINITGVTNSDDLVRRLTSEISRRVGR